MILFETLRGAALAALKANRVFTARGEFIAAGGTQFRTLWVRDFCLSVPGLLEAGEAELVRRQIETILSFQRGNGLLARGLDVIGPKRRVVLNTALRFLPSVLRTPGYEGRPLKPEFLGEHHTPAHDSNALTVLAACQYAAFTGDRDFMRDQAKSLVRAIDYYHHGMHDGLFLQAAFSDWQDSARRSGAGLYTNLLLLLAVKGLRGFGHDFPWAGRLERRIGEAFFDESLGLFKQSEERDQIPLESNLWCVEHRLGPRLSTELYANLKRSSLWQSCGVPIAPPYPSREISWTTQAAGLGNYHDGLRWSWLMADAARIALLMEDRPEAERILAELERLVRASEGVAEVYAIDQPFPFRNWIYRSEQPFTWGAARILQALSRWTG